jgi:hypothetical protein
MANEDPWHRRHALTLASQLPENSADAMIVLEATMRLVREFISEPEPEKKTAPGLRGARARPPRAYFRFYVKRCTHLTTNFSPELCSSHCPIFYSTNFWDDSRAAHTAS